jgi:hypothetical protein
LRKCSVAAVIFGRKVLSQLEHVPKRSDQASFDCRDTVDRLFMDDDNVKKYTTHIVFDVVKTGLAITTTTGTRKGG